MKAVRRKRYLVQKQVQGALGLRIAIHWFVFLIASVLVTCVLRMPGRLEHPTLSAGFLTALIEQIPAITVLLALLPWFVYDSLKLSNRFAGPMVRLRQAILQLTQDDEVPPVSFRKGDFWGEIADDFNCLRTRVLNDRTALESISQSVVAEAESTRETKTCLPALDLPIANVQATSYSR